MKADDRIITAITFLVVGPLVGALWVWSAAVVIEIARGAPNATRSALEAFPYLLGAGYLGGLLPAAIAGFVFAALPARWQRAVIALPIGAAVTWLLWELAQLTLGMPRVAPLSAYFLLVGAGALAAAVSAFIGRLILEARGRHYMRDGGKG